MTWSKLFNMHDSLVTKRKGTRKSKLTISKEYKLPSREGISTYHWHNAKDLLSYIQTGNTWHYQCSKAHASSVKTDVFFKAYNMNNERLYEHGTKIHTI